MNFNDPSKIPDYIRQRLPMSDPAYLPPAPVAVGPVVEPTLTSAEERFTNKAESKLQAEIANYLRLHNIYFIRPDMRKKSSLPLGHPDFTFAYKPRNAGFKYAIPVAIEAKLPGKKPESHQLDCHAVMRANGWVVIVACSVGDVQNLLRALDRGEEV